MKPVVLAPVALLALLCGCFDAAYLPGNKCSPMGECPPDQVCVVVGSSSTCKYTTPHDACNLVAGTGCPDDYKCTLAAPDMPSTVCVLDGGLTEGTPCVNLGIFDECASGLICLQGACRAVCDPATREGCGADTCVPFGSYAVCAETCDPFAPQCPDGVFTENCYVDALGATLCLPTLDDLLAGEVCTEVHQCSAGVACIDGVCRTICDFAASGGQQGTCTAGQTCQQVGSNIGVCR